MKTLLQKELRENVKLAVLGMMILIILLLIEYAEFARTIKDLALGSTNVPRDSLEPLASRSFLTGLGWFCGLFGIVLGWFQTYRERQRDLWSFLVHRPMTRTGIFLSKAAAGLSLYAVACGVPLAAYIAWAAMPGHVPAPFEWATVLPVLAYFLMGPVCYLAGMLTGLRSARWYASRGLPLGMGLLLVTAAVHTHAFWQALLLLLAGGAVLGTAVWGAFHTHGSYEGQPTPGRLALTLSLTLGVMVVIFFVAMLLSPFLLRWPGSYSWSSYVMTKDGGLYKASQGDNRPNEILDLNGKPMLDPRTGRPIDPASFHDHGSRNYTTMIGDYGSPSYFNSWRWFSFWRTTPGTVWYYWPRYGRLVGYDVSTRRAIGSLGPKGFAADLAGAGDHFDYPPGDAPGTYSCTLKTAAAVYRVDPEKRRVEPLFVTGPQDPVLTTIDIRENVYDWDYTLIATKQQIVLVKPNGAVMWKTAFEPHYPQYDRLSLSILNPPGNVALWIMPSYQANARSDWKLPLRILWFAGDQRLKSTEVPDLAGQNQRRVPLEQFMACMSPPAFLASVPMFTNVIRPGRTPGAYVWSSLAVAALVCVPVGWWLGTRYRFTLAARLGWAVFHLVAGIPGLLAFLSAQEWPAKVPCPACGQPRVVTRESCEHCGAAFGPPEKTGIEVFEEATA